MPTILIIGHPLVAIENSLAFEPLEGFNIYLIAPTSWKARSLGHSYTKQYSLTKSNTNLKQLFLPVWFSGYNSLFLWRGLSKQLKKIRPDLIYCWEEPWCLATWQIRKTASYLNKPWIFYSAENRPKALPWFFQRLQKLAFISSMGCIAPTDAVTHQLRYLGFKKPVGIVPLWVRPSQNHLFDTNKPCLAYVGRLITLKRVDWLIEALIWLPDFTLKIIGDGPERSALKNLAQQCKCENRVLFFGHCPNEKIPEALIDCGLVVIPTAETSQRAEQFGKAALEGIAYGLPVLTSRSGHYPELEKQIPTLSAQDFTNPQGLAESIKSIFANYPSLETRLMARERVNRLYGPTAAAAAIHTFFISLFQKIDG